MRLRKDGQPDQRAARREDHLSQLIALLDEPRAVADLAAALEVTERAVYFLFAALELRGRTVARVGPKAAGKYVLLSSVKRGRR